MTTSTAPTAPDRIRDFVADVATHFDDLPVAERQELLDDLEQHLLELAAEDEDGLAAELTSPAAYAAELRHSAGLPADPGSRRPSALHRLADRWAARFRALRDRPGIAPVVDFLPELRPAWWVVRAWALLVVVAMVATGGPWSRHVPIPGRSLLGLLALAGAVVVSVRAGRDGADRATPWRVGDAAAAVALLVVMVGTMSSGPTVEYVDVVHEDWQPAVLRHPDGEPITNLYLYDLEGNPVTDVLVHDGLGRPVEVGDLDAAGFADLETVHARDRFGVPIRHLYPLEQYVVESDEVGETERRPRPAPFLDREQDGAQTGTEQPTADTSAGPSPSELEPTADPEPTSAPTDAAPDAGTP